MITPTYNLTATERVLPLLSLDFTSALLDPRITFTRPGATATRVNQHGLIETVAADTPRFDFDPITLVCRGLLIEGQRKNLFLQSSFQSGWTVTRATLVPNSILAPDGTMTGGKLVENNQALTSHRMTQIVSYVAGNSYSISTFAKAGERSSFGFRFFSTAFGSSQSQYFDLQNGVLLNTVSGITASITPAGDGWYRCTATRAVTASTTSGAISFDLSIGRVFEYDGDGVSGAYFWGAQIEQAEFPTSYIPTEATTVTRNADVATITGTNFSDWYNASKGTFRTDFISIANGNRPVISVDDNTADESLILKTQGAAPTFEVVEGGSPQASVVAGTVVANTSAFAYASYDVNYFGIARPSARQVDTSGTVPTVDRMRIGADQAANYFNGHVQTIQYWD